MGILVVEFKTAKLRNKLMELIQTFEMGGVYREAGTTDWFRCTMVHESTAFLLSLSGNFDTFHRITKYSPRNFEKVGQR